MRYFAIFYLLITFISCSEKGEVEKSYDHIAGGILNDTAIWIYKSNDGTDPNGSQLLSKGEYTDLKNKNASNDKFKNREDAIYNFSKGSVAEINILRQKLSEGATNWDSYISKIFISLNGLTNIPESESHWIDKYRLGYEDFIKTIGLLNNTYTYTGINSYDASLVVGAYKWNKFYLSHINRNELPIKISDGNNIYYASKNGELLNEDRTNILKPNIDNEGKAGFDFTSSIQKGKEEILYPKTSNTKKDGTSIISEGKHAVWFFLLDEINREGNNFKHRKALFNSTYTKLGAYVDDKYGCAVIRFN